MSLKSVVLRLLIYKENSTNCYFSIYLLGWETLVNKYKEVEREKVTYEPVSDILSRLKANETAYLSGYNELTEMLEEGVNE